MKPNSEVSERIIDRTIYLIGTRGSTTVSVREIAREADVNVAAINYYFDSKEKLFDVVEERFVSAFAEVVDKLDDEGYPPEERLIRWTNEIMEYLLDYPGILNFVSRQVNAPDRDSFGGSLQGLTQRSFQLIRGLLRQILGTEDEPTLNFKTALLTSALAQPESILRGSPFDGQALRDPTTRQKFLDMLIELLKR